jgi:8-oxo-dGTP diphosphatase
MAREPVLAAGGIVLRREQPPRIAVVRLRKRDEWVLPKGKLDNGETARDAAEREVLEETGHDVTVHEFLGTLAYESGGRSKIVHYWRMEAAPEQAYELMNDIKAVEWLPLDLAVGRLSRAYERAFLSHVGPHALENAALAGASRRAKAKAPVAKKRRSRQAPAPKPPISEPLPVTAQAETVPPPPASEPQLVICEIVEVEPLIQEPEIAAVLPAAPEQAEPAPPEPEMVLDVAVASDVDAASDAHAASDVDADSETAASVAGADAEGQRRSLAQKVWAWLGRAA